jgi:hypothetical protein
MGGDSMKDATKKPQPSTPAPPEKPVPGPNDKVMKIWRDEKGQVWVDDDNMGAANAFNLVHWAQMICWSPFFGRQIQAEIAQAGFIMGRMVHEHEFRMHGATSPGSDLVSPRGQKLPPSGVQSPADPKNTSPEPSINPTKTPEPLPGTGSTGDTLQSPPKR